VKRRRGDAETTTSGTGFIISKDAHIMTNYHVVAEKITRRNWRGEEITEQYDVQEIRVVTKAGTRHVAGASARVIAADPKNDLAILKADELAVKDYLKFGEYAELTETQNVWCFGYPLGEKLAEDQHGPSITITQGQITSLRKRDGKLQRVQTDASVTAGNSGGPVVDADGNVIGVIRLKIGLDSGINMAIPSRKAQSLFRKMKEGKSLSAPSVSKAADGAEKDLAREEQTAGSFQPLPEKTKALNKGMSVEAVKELFPNLKRDVDIAYLGSALLVFIESPDARHPRLLNVLWVDEAEAIKQRMQDIRKRLRSVKEGIDR
jgi:S1-C subfamily serine protease